MNKKSTCKDLAEKIKVLEQAVSAAEKRQLELQQSEEKFRVLADLSPAAIMLYQDGRWIYANKATETVFGYSAQELLSMNYGDIARQDFKVMVQECKEKFQRGDENTYRYELKIIRKDGSDIWVELRGVSTMIGGVSVGVISVADITDRKKAEQERYNYEKLHGFLETAATVCHEFNQPLQIISGYSELLLKNSSANDPITTKLIEISKQISKMSNITKKLMKINKYETQDYAGFSRIIKAELSSL